mgnify:CR=1 FL=1|jgi:hypothetical protein
MGEKLPVFSGKSIAILYQDGCELKESREFIM